MVLINRDELRRRPETAFVLDNSIRRRPFNEKDTRVAQRIAAPERPDVFDVDEAFRLLCQLENRVAGGHARSLPRIETTRCESWLERQARDDI